MKKEKLLHYIAPCSLLCYTCLALKDGAFSECSPRLSGYCEGVCEFLSLNMPEDERDKFHLFFNEFQNALKQLSGGMCHGCRNVPSSKKGCIKGCVIPDCAQERGVDFCAECNEFPCQKAKDFFATHSNKITKIWEDGSKRIKEIGIEAYFEEKKNLSHYIHYKNNAN